MNASPPCSVEPELLRGWLDGEMSGEAAQSLEAHIDACPACQAELDRLTACRLRSLNSPISPRAYNRTKDPSTRPTSKHDTEAPTPSAGMVDFVPTLNGFADFRPLGRGGMGTVFLARQIALDRLVAVKFISGDRQHDAASIARMRVEARIIASLKHPQIVTIHDVIEHEGRPVLVLEYVEGGNLAELRSRERLNPLLACRLMELVAQGVHGAHQRGVLHRDLKPSNILMDGYKPKITDFGLARQVDTQERLTSSGKLFGTPHYMAPEVIRLGSDASSPASDIFALGVILYELISGDLPFAGGTTYDVLERIVRQDPPPLTSRVEDVDPRIALACEAALQKDPSRRLQSAAEFSHLLRSIVDEERAGQIQESNSTGAGTIRRAGNARAASTSIATHSSSRQPAHSLTRIGWLALALLVAAIAIIVFASRPPAVDDDIDALATQDNLRSHETPESNVNAPVPLGEADSIETAVSLEGTHWIGWFDFHPVDNSPDGDAELSIETHNGNEFAGTYYSEQRNYAWKVEGRFDDGLISWEFIEAIKDNEPASVVGMTEVSGTLVDDRIVARWRQTGLTPSDADMQFNRVQDPTDGSVD